MSIPTPYRKLFSATALLLLCMPVRALTYLVGAGSTPTQCDFNSLQEAINAAANNPGEDFIRVASDQSYIGLALTIGQQDLTITGGYPSCEAALPPDAQPTGNTVLDGAGGAAAPVVSITGSGVRALASLQIRNGDNVQGNGSGCGGGIRFEGRGELVLRNTGVSQNDANFGGGICFAGTATPSALSIRSGSSINNNMATTGNGGGILVGGTARLFVLEDNTLIAFNEAPNGDGGGIYQAWPSRIDIGSPGFGSLGVIYANSARRGGGVAVYAQEGVDGVMCARFFTTDPLRPVRLQQNRATEVGGALLARSNEDAFASSVAVVRAYDFLIDGNTAPNGSAAFLGGDTLLGLDTGSHLILNASTSSEACNEPLFELGRVPCDAAADCNRISDNRAEDGNGQPTPGNVVELRDGSDVSGRLLEMSGNTATRLLSWSDSDYSRITVADCALVGNDLTLELIRGFSEGSLQLSNCTIGGNALGGTHVLRMDEDAYMVLDSTIIAQPGKTTLSHPDTDDIHGVLNTWIVASETASLRPDPTLLNAPARFVDPSGGDYRLRVGSQAVDFVPAGAAATDLDGRPRDVDLGENHANSRARDAGAFERQRDDAWLVNGDFVSDLRLWTNLDPTHATWTGDANAPGSVGGSLLFSIPVGSVGPTERRPALSQCFNVPAPGEYQVFGRALVAGNFTSSDYPVVRWRLRYGNDACLGPADGEGERFFGRSSTVWQPLTQPLLIPVDAGSWTWNTTIELVLEAAQNQSSPLATALFARFDEIEIMRVPTEPEIFADGFED